MITAILGTNAFLYFCGIVANCEDKKPVSAVVLTLLLILNAGAIYLVNCTR